MLHQLITDNIDLWTAAETPRSTTGRGSNKKIELTGIKKLRELILGMALRGLFEGENQSLPESIAVDISKAKKKYFDSIHKKAKEYSFGPPELHEFDLPDGWLWKRVGELCDLQTGATPSRQKPEYFGGNNRWLVSGDINQENIEECEGRITDEGLASSNCKILPKGTILIALNGQGKTRASVAHLKIPAACNQSLVGMIPFDEFILNPRFLFLSLQYRYFEIREITGQNQRRGLNMGLVSELSIPLPPLSEQHRIVAKVDELMVLCDQLEQQQLQHSDTHHTLVTTLLDRLSHATDNAQFQTIWSQLATNFDTLFITEASIDQLKQTLLQLAVMGKLVPQDPNDEPASVLLEKIAAEKAALIKAGKIKKQKSLPVITEDEEPFELPNGWVWAKPDAFSHTITDGEHFRPPTQDKGVYFLSAKDIRADGVSLESPLYISQATAEKALQRCNPEKGDILIVSRGATVGRMCTVDIDDIFCLLGSVILIKPVQPINSDYLKTVMKTPQAFDQLVSASGSTAQPAIYLRDIKKIVFPIAPLSEQHRIVAKVDELMALCDHLKARLNQAQTTQQQLAHAFVQLAVA